MTKGIFESLSDWLTADTVLDSFANSAFRTESEYLKNKRAELVANDMKITAEGKNESKLLVNNPNREVSLHRNSVL